MAYSSGKFGDPPGDFHNYEYKFPYPPPPMFGQGYVWMLGRLGQYFEVGLDVQKNSKNWQFKNVITFLPVDSARDSALSRPNLQSRYFKIF